MKSGTKKFLIIILILGVLLVGVLLLLINAYKESTLQEEYSEEDIEIISEEVNNYLSDKITPNGISKLYGKYEGSNELSDLYRKLYLFVNYLPSVYNEINNYDSEQLNTFYVENSEEIKENLGITSAELFIEFISYFKENGYNGETYESSEIDSETFEYVGKYFSFNLNITFENAENIFTVKVYFADYNAADPLVYYEIIK